MTEPDSFIRRKKLAIAALEAFNFEAAGWIYGGKGGWESTNATNGLPVEMTSRCFVYPTSNPDQSPSSVGTFIVRFSETGEVVNPHFNV